MDILDYLTPEERSAYSAKMQPTDGQRVASFGLGLGDAIQNFGSGRRSNDQDQYMQGLKADENLARVEQNMLGTDRRAQAKDEMLKKLTETQRRAVLNTIGPDYDQSLAADDALKLYGIDEGNKARMTAAKMALSRPGVRDRQSEINERFKQGKVENLSKRIEKAEIPELEGSLNVVDSLIEGKKDVPGVGMFDSLTPDFLVSEEGKTIRRNIAGVANQILKSRSGAAVTDQEYKRFLNEAMTGKFTSEESLKTGIKKMRQDIVNMKTNIAKGYSPDVVESYQSNGGTIDLGQSGNDSFPRKVRNGNKTATVQNQKELEEAMQDGFQ